MKEKETYNSKEMLSILRKHTKNNAETLRKKISYN
jgi:hypothetical protein